MYKATFIFFLFLLTVGCNSARKTILAPKFIAFEQQAKGAGPAHWDDMKFLGHPGGCRFEWLQNGDLKATFSKADTPLLKRVQVPKKDLSKIPQTIMGFNFTGIYQAPDFPPGYYLVIFLNKKVGDALFVYQNLIGVNDVIVYYSAGNINIFQKNNIVFHKTLFAVR